MAKKKAKQKRPHRVQPSKRIPRRAILVGIVLAIAGVVFLYRSFAATSSPDLNGDGKVTIVDISMLLTNFNKTGSGIRGDINGDGKVTVVDLSIMLSSFGKTVGGGGSGDIKPGQFLNLRNWYLTLPTGSSGSPDSIYQPALNTYSSQYFQLNSTRDGVVFKAPIDGAHTANSDYTRSELRETSSNGTLPWGWPTGSGTHVLTATESIQHLPSSSGKVSFAQIHGPGADWYLILMATATGNGTAKLTVKDETGKADGQVIASNYTLGTKFNLVITVVNGKVTIRYNGNQVVSTTNDMDDAYFKIGTYNQSSSGDYGQVTVHSLSVTHN